MDMLVLVRMQFGITTIYRFFFVPLTLELSLLVAIMKTVYVWAILIATLFVGYFFLEDLDYRAGNLFPFLGVDDTGRRIIINTIEPRWDGNEVWLITAGGAMFAAFPQRLHGWVFVMMGLTIILSATAVRTGLYPRVLISRLNPAWNLTIYNTSSSLYTLTIMNWLALTLPPFILAYQAWNDWIFRKRIGYHADIHY